MDDKSLLSELQKSGRVGTAEVASWSDSAELLPAFDAIGRDGATALIKIDGGRSDDAVYTVVISGGRLGEAFFHRDGANLSVLLLEAISFYREKLWTQK